MQLYRLYGCTAVRLYGCTAVQLQSMRLRQCCHGVLRNSTRHPLYRYGMHSCSQLYWYSLSASVEHEAGTVGVLPNSTHPRLCLATSRILVVILLEKHYPDSYPGRSTSTS